MRTLQWIRIGLPSKFIEFLRNINKYSRFNQRIVTTVFFLFCREKIIVVNRKNFVGNDELVNSKMFESLNIIKYWSWRARKRNHYDLKTCKNSMNSMASECFDGNVYYYRKISSLYEKVNFLTSPNPSRHHRLLLLFW